MTADDLHAQGMRQVLAPCIDVVRDLRWGRVRNLMERIRISVASLRSQK